MFYVNKYFVVQFEKWTFFITQKCKDIVENPENPAHKNKHTISTVPTTVL